MAFIPDKLGITTRSAYASTPDESAMEATRLSATRSAEVAAIRTRNGAKRIADEATKKNIALLQAKVATLETTRLVQAERLSTISGDLKEASTRLDAANLRVSYQAPAQSGWLRSQDPDQGAAQMAVAALTPAAKAVEAALAVTDAALPEARVAAAAAKAAYKPPVLESEELPDTFGRVPPASDTIISPAAEPLPPVPAQVVVAVTPSVNPYEGYSEAQLRAELVAIESAVADRISKGLSAGYDDLTIIALLQRRALIISALSQILIKKYGLYAAGGLAALLVIKNLLRRSK